MTAAISTNMGTETKTNEFTKVKMRLVISGTAIGPNQPSAKMSATSGRKWNQPRLKISRGRARSSMGIGRSPARFASKWAMVSSATKYRTAGIAAPAATDQ